MSSNSGDNYDLAGDIPGFDPPGKRSNLSAYGAVNENDSLMDRLKLFYTDGVSAWDENRRLHSEDLNFIYNAEAQGQWDPVVLQNRRGKPSYTFNRVIGPVNMIVSDMRQTKPSGLVRPASDGASQPVADIYGGLCRSIEQASRADSIYKEQYKYAVAGGFGAWRVMPMYMTDDGDGAFDQVLRVINITNPQTVIWDPQCADPCAGDANQCIVAERISEDVYKALYKDGSGQSFSVSRDSYGWFTDKEVRIAEYFERIPYEKKIALMTDGTVKNFDQELKDVEATFDAKGFDDQRSKEAGIVRIAKDKNGKLRTRSTVVWKVLWVKVDGSNILEGPYVYDWKRIPIVRCPGRYINIEGKKKFQSAIRHSKDAQRAYNSRASDMIERSALLPKAPYLVTPTMVKGYESVWNEANVQSRPYLPYNVDPKATGSAGKPERVAPLDLPQGAIALAQMAIQDIQATTGFFDPALGNADDMNRVSGKALVQHTRRSDLGSYEFVDGFGAALQLTWEMFIDMIPTVYDSERVERIIGHDGVEKLVKVNGQTDNGSIINDLIKGSYDVAVNIGPSYQTARQETLATLIDASTSIPSVAQFCPDLLVKNIDSPDAQEMARRLRIPLIWQGIIEPSEAEKAAGVPQKPADPQKQLEQALDQARLKEMQDKNRITSARADANHVEGTKLVYETAGRHLQNIKMATEMGNAAAATQSEQQAAQLDLAHQAATGQQNLQQQSAQGQQDIQQQQQQHALDLSAAVHGHAASLAQGDEIHAKSMTRAQQLHDQKLKHADELHTKKLQHVKALAALKPKKPAKKAA